MPGCHKRGTNVHDNRRRREVLALKGSEFWRDSLSMVSAVRVSLWTLCASSTGVSYHNFVKSARMEQNLPQQIVCVLPHIEVCCHSLRRQHTQRLATDILYG